MTECALGTGMCSQTPLRTKAPCSSAIGGVAFLSSPAAALAQRKLHTQAHTACPGQPLPGDWWVQEHRPGPFLVTLRDHPNSSRPMGLAEASAATASPFSFYCCPHILTDVVPETTAPKSFARTSPPQSLSPWKPPWGRAPSIWWVDAVRYFFRPHNNWMRSLLPLTI